MGEEGKEDELNEVIMSMSSDYRRLQRSHSVPHIASRHDSSTSGITATTNTGTASCSLLDHIDYDSALSNEHPFSNQTHHYNKTKNHNYHHHNHHQQQHQHHHQHYDNVRAKTFRSFNCCTFYSHAIFIAHLPIYSSFRSYTARTLCSWNHNELYCALCAVCVSRLLIFKAKKRIFFSMCWIFYYAASYITRLNRAVLIVSKFDKTCGCCCVCTFIHISKSYSYWVFCFLQLAIPQIVLVSHFQRVFLWIQHIDCHVSMFTTIRFYFRFHFFLFLHMLRTRTLTSIHRCHTTHDW